MAGLKAIEQLLQTKELKLKKSAETCWLSVDNACQTLLYVLPAVITSLESEAEERGSWFVRSSSIVQVYCYSVHVV